MAIVCPWERQTEGCSSDSSGSCRSAANYSDHRQISPAASSPEILHHIVWRAWLFTAYPDERWLYYHLLTTSVIHFSLRRMGSALDCAFELYRWLALRETKHHPLTTAFLHTMLFSFRRWPPQYKPLLLIVMSKFKGKSAFFSLDVDYYNVDVLFCSVHSATRFYKRTTWNDNPVARKTPLHWKQFCWFLVPRFLVKNTDKRRDRRLTKYALKNLMIFGAALRLNFGLNCLRTWKVKPFGLVEGYACCIVHSRRDDTKMTAEEGARQQKQQQHKR